MESNPNESTSFSTCISPYIRSVAHQGMPPFCGCACSVNVENWTVRSAQVRWHSTRMDMMGARACTYRARADVLDDFMSCQYGSSPNRVEADANKPCSLKNVLQRTNNQGCLQPRAHKQSQASP